MAWLRRIVGSGSSDTAEADKAEARAAEAKSEAARKAAVTRAQNAAKEAKEAAAKRKAGRQAKEAAKEAKEAADRAAQRVIERRFGRACRLLRIHPTAEQFECSECGRWADVLDAARVHGRIVETDIGFSLLDWQRVADAAGMRPYGGSRPDALRPAYLQREFGKDYDEAVRVFEKGVELGLLDATAKGVITAPAKCSDCYERRAAGPAPSPSEQVTRDPIPPQLRFRVLQRDAFRCQYCGRSARDGATLHLDHVVPVAAGGKTTEGNLITACETCNFGKSATEVI